MGLEVRGLRDVVDQQISLFRGRCERKTFRSSLFRIVVQGAEGREG